MKRLYFALLFLSGFCHFQAQAQDAGAQLDETIYEEQDVDAVPDFPGGVDAFYKQFYKSFEAPKIPGLVDKVVLTFVVETDGTPSNIKVIHDAGFGTAEQTIKILESFPKWLPGTKGRKKVRVQHTLPIAIVTE